MRQRICTNINESKVPRSSRRIQLSGFVVLDQHTRSYAKLLPLFLTVVRFD